MIKKIVSLLIIAVIVISTMAVDVVATIDSTKEQIIIDPVYGYECTCRLIIGTKYATVSMYCNPTRGSISKPSGFTATYLHKGEEQLDYHYEWGSPDTHSTVTLPATCDNVRAHYHFMETEFPKMMDYVPN